MTLGSRLIDFFRTPLDFLKQASNTETDQGTESVREEEIEKLCMAAMAASTLDTTLEAVTEWAIAHGVPDADVTEFAHDVLEDFFEQRRTSEESMSDKNKSNTDPVVTGDPAPDQKPAVVDQVPPTTDLAEFIKSSSAQVAAAEAAAIRCIELVESLSSKVETLHGELAEFKKSSAAVAVVDPPAAPAAPQEPVPAAVQPEVLEQIEKLKSQIAQLEAQPVNPKAPVLAVGERAGKPAPAGNMELNLQRMLKARPDEIDVTDVLHYETTGNLTPRAQAYLESVAQAKV